MEVITGDLPSTPTNNFKPNYGGECANTLPSPIDDLHICGRDLAIDVPGKILGSACPLLVHKDSTTKKVTPVTGHME